MSPRSKRTLAGMLLCGLVLAWLGSLTIGPEPPASPAAPPTAIDPTGPSHTLAPIDTFAAIKEHPLFTADRRPVLPPAAPSDAMSAAPSTPPPILTGVTLLGVVISDARHEAVLRTPDGKVSTVGEGEMLNGWMLQSVRPDRAVFSHPSGSSTEVLFPVAPSMGPSVPSPAQAASLPVVRSSNASVPPRLPH